MPTYARVHLVVVHFPIALLAVASVLDWWQAWRQRATTSTALLFAVGIVGAWVAVASGFLNRNWQIQRGLIDTPEALALVTKHQWLSLSTAVIFSAVLVLKLLRQTTPSHRWQHLLQAIGLGLLTVATHLGGELAHGSG